MLIMLVAWVDVMMGPWAIPLAHHKHVSVFWLGFLATRMPLVRIAHEFRIYVGSKPLRVSEPWAL